MTDDELRALAREAVAHVDRGECTVFNSDDPQQPAGAFECFDRRCEMCDWECPDPHIHVFERSSLLEHPLPEEPQLAYTAEAWDELRRSVQHVGEMWSARPVGVCSEACALRFVGGEPTLHELSAADELPSLTVLSRSLPSPMVDER